MALIPESFFKAVVAIGQVVENKVAWIGTGFLYGHTLESSTDEARTLIYVVTNKHVLSGMDSVVLRFENASGTSNEFVIALKADGRPIWHGHENKEVDIAVVLMNGNVLHSIIGQLNIFLDSTSTLPTTHGEFAHVCEGDGVFLLGFPMGLVDGVQNLPIARGGTIARVKDCKGSRSKTFLIDCQTFPGNSGGPVVLRPEIVSITGTTPLTRSYLIGVVAAYLPYRDVAVSRQTGREKIIFEENSGLSIVYSVDCIRETIQTSLAASSQVEAQPQRVSPEIVDSNQVRIPQTTS